MGVVCASVFVCVCVCVYVGVCVCEVLGCIYLPFYAYTAALLALFQPHHLGSTGKPASNVVVTISVWFSTQKALPSPALCLQDTLSIDNFLTELHYATMYGMVSVSFPVAAL